MKHIERKPGDAQSVAKVTGTMQVAIHSVRSSGGKWRYIAKELKSMTFPPVFGVAYTERGQLKMYNRIVASGFSLPVAESSVLLFILQRTVGWGKVWEAISPVEFERGVFRRKAGERDVIIQGTGLPAYQISQAVAALRDMGAVETEERGSRTVYRIIPEWVHPDLQKIWEVNENDYIYHESDRQQPSAHPANGSGLPLRRLKQVR